MQYNRNLWHAKQYVKLGKVGKVQITAAQKQFVAESVGG